MDCDLNRTNDDFENFLKFYGEIETCVMLF